MDKSSISITDLSGNLLDCQEAIFSDPTLGMFYDPIFKNREKFYVASLWKFESLRRKILEYDRSVCVSNIAKLPFLYRDIGNNMTIDFPVCINDNAVSCGAGRIVVAGLMYPRLRLDCIMQSRSSNPHLIRIRDLNDLIDLLDSRNYGYTRGSHYQIKVGDDNFIYATDKSTEIGNRFPYIKQTLSPKMVGFVDDFIRQVIWLPLCDIDIQYIKEWIIDICIFGTEIIDRA